MLRVTAGILVFATIVAASGMAQDLSTVVLPSVDEVYEALIEGEITYDQYVVLLELIESGITPQNRFLLDEIPNLADFTSLSDSNSTTLEAMQMSPFWRAARQSKLHRQIDYQYYTTLADTARERYRSSMTFDFNPHWSTNLRITKELSGRERFTARSLSYSSDSGTVRSIQIGSFQTRYGLGSVIGYRGKILHYRGRLDDESFLFPDNGGFNGLNLSLQAGNFGLGTLVSSNRDTAYHLLSAAQLLQHNSDGWQQTLIFGVNRIADRSTEKGITDLKLAANVSRKYRDGAATVEYCAQVGEKKEFGNVLVEGVHRSGQSDFRYAAWHYGNGFIDLTSGSKAAAISRTSSVSDIGFTYTDKRAGQSGVLTKTITELGPSLKLTTEFLGAMRNRDSFLVQIRPGMEWTLNRQWSWTFDYLHTIKSRVVDSLRSEPVDRRIRLESVFRSSSTFLRTALAHTSSAARGDYFSLFFSARHATKSGSLVEAWSNLGRVINGTIDYWYGYVRSVQPLLDQLNLAAKLSHRCDYANRQSHETAVSLELIAEL